jgi:tRNA threonylcarbamoyladenosine biosynthesis protein TsaB
VKMQCNDKILFLDASSLVVHIGILSNNKWVGYFKSDQPALQSLFQGIEVSLKLAALELKDITGFAYCEGPGSLLGIRLASMAIRAWKEQECFKNIVVYAYNSFDVSLELIKKIHNPNRPFAVVSQLRKGYWSFLSNNCLTGNISEINEAELSSFQGSLWLFKQKKLSLNEKNLQMMTFDYSLEECPEIFIQRPLLRSVEQPDAMFVHELEYVKWDSKRHRKENRK